MDPVSRSVAMCVEGTQMEFAGRVDDARRLYALAWEAATNDYDRTVAAHYVAHLEQDPVHRLRWNEVALENATRAEHDSVAPLMGSLYVSLGHSHELVGDLAKAEKYYVLAAGHGVVHQAE